MSSSHLQVLGCLAEQHNGCWVAHVPERYGTFLGRPLSLHITTYRQDPAYIGRSYPPPGEAELALAEKVLDGLAVVLDEGQRQFRIYTEKMLKDPEAAQHVSDPHIWLNAETIIRHGPQRWSLVVHRDDWPDFGYHIEFDGLKHVETWSGD